MTSCFRLFLSSHVLFSCAVLWAGPGTSLYGQDLQHDYTPIRSFRAPEKLIHDIQDQYKSWKTLTTIDNKKVKSAWEGFVDQKSRFIFIMDSINVLMYNDTISHFLNSIKDQIVARNEALHGQSYHIFTCRSLEPNAVSLGEGAIMVNTGLLERLTTTDEIAFVIAHEMGHDIMHHSYNDGLRYCKSIYEGGFDRKVQKMQRKQAGRRTELKAMMNAFKAQHMQYSRQHELEADSIGFRLASNAGFQKSEAITVLKVLDEADHLRFVDSLILQSFFQFEAYPFKSYWLDGESSTLSWEADPSLSITPDSLKSHPDCSIRIARLEQLSPGIEQGNAQAASPETTLQSIAAIIPFEVVEGLVNSHEYVLALYLSLHMQSEYPQNIYLKCVADYCLYELADAMRRNVYLEYVEFPDKDFSSGYNHLLVFLHNMNSSSLKNIFHYYLQSIRSPEKHVYKAFLEVLDNQPVTQENVDIFENQYHNPYFTSLLQAKTQNNFNRK